MLKTDGEHRVPPVWRAGDTGEVPEHPRFGESLLKAIGSWYPKNVKKLARNMWDLRGGSFS